MQGNSMFYDVQDTEELRQIAEDAAATLASVVDEMGQEGCCLDILGLRRDGKDIGEWTVTVERKREGIYH